MDKMNNVFICLITTAIYHHLKQWESGVPDQNGPEFKAEIRWCMSTSCKAERRFLMRCTATFMRHLNTWGKITKERKSLIMRITKSRIMARLAATGRAYVAEDTTGF